LRDSQRIVDRGAVPATAMAAFQRALGTEITFPLARSFSDSRTRVAASIQTNSGGWWR
jgi:hypothetical protein